MAFVGSPRADARIVAIDVSEAKNVAGIHGVYTATDVPGANRLAAAAIDAELLAASECRYVGQPVVVLAGENLDTLREALAAVRLELTPHASDLTADESIVGSDFGGETRRIARGNPQAGFATAQHVFEGTFRAGSPDHPEPEAPATLASVDDNGQIIIQATTRHAIEVRGAVARLLGLTDDQVVCFGALTKDWSARQESRATRDALLAALIAFKTRRPARIIDPGILDLRVQPKAPSYFAQYKVGFASDGRIHALTIDQYSDNARADESEDDVVTHALLNADSAYFVPHFGVTLTLYWSGLPVNMASRDMFAGLAVAVIENIIEEIADHLGLDPLEVRRRNCYDSPGRDTTHFGQVVSNNTLPVLLDRIAESTGYAQRRHQISRFNETSRTHLRGLAVTPVKYGTAVAPRTQRDGNAQVDIDVDGTIRVAIGRPEMGQTLSAIFRQRVADQFAVNNEVVRLVSRPNPGTQASPTTSATRVDLDGTAALRACEVLRDRLADVAIRHLALPDDPAQPSLAHIRFEDARVFDVRRPDQALKFKDLVRLAHEAEIPLGERGSYTAPFLELDGQPSSGHPRLDFTTGAAVSEVEVDRATGRITATRVELLIDIGESADPAVDRSKAFARFIKGMRWALTDDWLDSQSGEPLSHATNINAVFDFDGLPRSVKIDFLESPDKQGNFHADKSMGPLPFLLGVSVWTAAKQALNSLAPRQSSALSLPATADEVLRCLARFDSEGANEQWEQTDSV